MIKRLDVVRIKGMPEGDINEFARVFMVHDDGSFWISNLNMPFQGTITGNYTADQLEGERERGKSWSRY